MEKEMAMPIAMALVKAAAVKAHVEMEIAGVETVAVVTAGNN